MAALTRNADRYPGFHSTEADAPLLHRCVAPYLDRTHTIVDVGCGNAALWFAESPFNEHDRVWALDVQRHVTWARKSRPPNLAFMNAWPAAFPRTDKTPVTVFVKNVFSFLSSGSDYQRLFWSLPVGTQTLMVIQPQTPYAEDAKGRLNRYPFVRTTTLPWEDSTGLLWFIFVIQNFQAQWSHVSATRNSRGFVEACPDCNLDTRMEFDFLAETGHGQAVCMNCGFNQILHDTSIEKLTESWNNWRIADYTMTDTHRM